MKWRISSLIKVSTAALALALPFAATESQAMPSFARQTGMVCNSCHIGTDSVPNFTRTGRLFAMRGYTRPVVREKLRGDGQVAPGEPQYGGDYIERFHRLSLQIGIEVLIGPTHFGYKRKSL